MLHVRAQNVKSLLLEGIRIPPLLLPQALAVEDIPADWDRPWRNFKAGAEALKKLAQGNKALAPFLLEPFAEKQLFPAAGEKNKPLAVSLPLSFRRDKEAGALELIRVGEDQVDGDTATEPRVFRITDLGLTYKLGSNQVLLWVTSIKNAAPMAGVQVVGCTRDLEVFPLGQTDKDGILIFQTKGTGGAVSEDRGRLPPGEAGGGATSNWSACWPETANDVSYILLKPGESLKPEGIWQVRAGAKVRRLKGQVFTERGVYRPGETVHFKGLVREYLQGRIISPQGDGCSFEITSPKGEKVFSGEETLSDFGGAAGEVTAAGHWPLGTYTLTMTFGPKEEASLRPCPKRSGSARRMRTRIVTDNNPSNNEAAKGPKNEANAPFRSRNSSRPAILWKSTLSG